MSSSHPVLDPSVLDRLADDVGGVDTVAAVADVYLEQLPIRLVALRDTVRSDPPACRRVAHSLKSASAALGLMEMAHHAAGLESVVEIDAEQGAESVAELDRVSGAAAEQLGAWRSSV